jgi:hypothetical protein
MTNHPKPPITWKIAPDVAAQVNAELKADEVDFGHRLDLVAYTAVETRRGYKPYIRGTAIGRASWEEWWVRPVGTQDKVKVPMADLRAFVQ